MNRKKIKPRSFIAGSESEMRGLSRYLSGQRLLLLVVLLFLGIISWPLVKTYSQRRLVEKEITDIQTRISEFEDKGQELQTLADYLSSGQSLEEQARLNLNLKKPGEAVIIFDDNQKKTVSSEVPTVTAETVNNFSKWWLYFFGK